MKIPHTIPKLILSVFTQKKTPEELASQYEGRVLRSEDVTWDEDLFKIGYVQPLEKQSLELVINDYPFYVKLVKEWNLRGEDQHAKAREQWEIDREVYLQKKESYDEKLHELDLMVERFGHNAGQLDDLLNADSDSSGQSDDDTDEFKRLRNLTEPTYVPEIFPDYAPVPPVLDQLTPDDRIHVIEELDIDKIPLDIAIETIPDEYYWERVCNDRWPEADPYHHGDSWKRMFMEKNVCEAIEAFHPAESEWEPLLDAIDKCGPFVITLALNNLIPECWGVPRKPVVQPIFEGDEPPPIDGTGVKFTPEDEGFEESAFMADFHESEAKRKEKLAAAKKRYHEDGREDEVTEEELLVEEAALEDADKKPRTNSHIDLSLVLPKLSKLSKLSLVYEMVEMGDNWEARFFEFTMQDARCEVLAKALVDTPTITHLDLNRSKMSGEQTKVLVRDGLLKMPHLKILNLNYNNMCASGALAIARLITDKTSRVRSTLHTLKMARNNIRSKGAKALAYALTLNTYLTFLDVRLNHIGNSGGEDMGHALVVNKSLQSLNLAANHLGEPTCLILGKMLQHNTTLKELDVSSNNLGVEGGDAIARALRVNKTILKLDVRLANTSLELEFDIESHLKKNRNRSSYFLTDREDIYPPEFEENDEEEEEEEEDEGEEEEYEVVTRFKAGEGDDDSDQDDDMVGIDKKVSKSKPAVADTEGDAAEEAEDEE